MTFVNNTMIDTEKALFEAAPEMLKTLEKIVNVFDEFEPVDATQFEIKQYLLKRANNVIQKARGLPMASGF